MTFVLCLLCLSTTASFTFAAVDSPSPDFNDPTQEIRRTDPGDAGTRQTLDISAPPAHEVIRHVPIEYFFPYRQSISARLGMAYDTKSEEGTNTPLLGGVQFMFSNRELRSYEFGADLLSTGSGVLHLARRWIFSRSRFRPYTKAGFGVRVIPSEQLATFLKYEHYQARGAAGFEYLVWNSISLRTEAEASVSVQSAQATITVGSSWAF